MFLFIIVTILILAIALGIGLVVVVGMQGYRREDERRSAARAALSPGRAAACPTRHGTGAPTRWRAPRRGPRGTARLRRADRPGPVGGAGR